jgi:phosphoribosyl 1,2-cyclic phosphodiesterase
MARRLGALGIEPAAVAAVVVTHEHRDHTRGVGVAARRWGWPIYMSSQTAAACRDLLRGEEEIRTFERETTFRVQSLEVHAFLTSHDAADPLAVTVRDPASGLKIGIATDLGRPTVPVRNALRNCHFLVLEANHDDLLLRDGPYPWSIKERIGGSRGHLSNRMAAELAAELHHPELGGVLLAHMSEECNDGPLALRAVSRALAAKDYRGLIEVATQEEPTPLFDVAALRARALGQEQLRLFGDGSA